jgi:hypothetical protein
VCCERGNEPSGYIECVAAEELLAYRKGPQSM